MPFYLTHQQVPQNKKCDISIFGTSGACGNYFRHLLGALPQHLPKHLDPCHPCHLHHFPYHHQARPSQVRKAKICTGQAISGISLGCLLPKVVGCVVVHVVPIFPALFLPLLTFCFGLLPTSTMHSVIVTQGGITCMISGESNQCLKIVINKPTSPFSQEIKKLDKYTPSLNNREGEYLFNHLKCNHCLIL